MRIWPAERRQKISLESYLPGSTCPSYPITIHSAKLFVQDNMEERLQKLIAAAGITSRRHAEELIKAGEVSVNGKVVTELGTRADPEKDHIKVKGRLINSLLGNREKRYVLMNKPKGYLSSASDPEGRPLVTDLLPSSLGRLYPVGRLDFNTEGLLLLTNDGEFTNFITSARNGVLKIYEAKVKGLPPEPAVARLRKGVLLDEKVRTAPAEIKKIGETASNAWYEVILRQGRNQQIRRMFDSIGHSVLKLKRIQIGSLRDDNLRSGEWRFLSPTEVKRLLRANKQRKPRSAKRVTRVGSKPR
ncbi:MAG TPA: pseudouridine synthase [Pyrinomonadaceae bacterium]|nr:pseudouridine synthase [Pyrinomonadaceae bacterium]